MIIHDSPGPAGPEELDDGFHVRYLGSVVFATRKKKVNMQTLQRPLLDLYTKSRRRGEDHRAVHPLALTQYLLLSDYGLVVAENEEDLGTGTREAVVRKVITPVSGMILWAAVRFHTRIMKRRMFGAAFVPLACSDAVVDKSNYVPLTTKHRFLVSLTHPSLFACFLHCVGSSKSVECHAFVCASAEDAMIICSSLDSIKQTYERIGSMELLFVEERSSRTSDVSERFFNNNNVLMPEMETYSIISASEKSNREITRQSHQSSATRWTNVRTSGPEFETCYENEIKEIPSFPDSNKKYTRNSHGIEKGRLRKPTLMSPHYQGKNEEVYNRSRSCERLVEKINGLDINQQRSKSCSRLADVHSSPEHKNSSYPANLYRNSSFSSLANQRRSIEERYMKISPEERTNQSHIIRKQILQNHSKSMEKINHNDGHSSSENDRNAAKANRCRSTERIQKELSLSPLLSRDKNQNQSMERAFNLNYSSLGREKVSTLVRNSKQVPLEHQNICISSSNRTNTVKTENLKESLIPEHERQHILEVIQKHSNLPYTTSQLYQSKSVDPCFTSESNVRIIPIRVAEQDRQDCILNDSNQKDSVTITQAINMECECDSQYSSDSTRRKNIEYNTTHHEVESDIDSRLERFTSSESGVYYTNSLNKKKQSQKSHKTSESTLQLPKQYSTVQSVSENLTENFPRCYVKQTSFAEKPTKTNIKEEMELFETMDFSSESEYSGLSNKCDDRQYVNEICLEDTLNQDIDECKTDQNCNHRKDRKISKELQTHADVHYLESPLTVSHDVSRRNKHKLSVHTNVSELENKNQFDMKNNGTTKIIIKVPYEKIASTEPSGLLSNGNTQFLPHGVRTYNRVNNVKNWSTLSQTSDSTCQGSAVCKKVATLPMTKMSSHHHKAIRFSSDDRPERRPSFLTSLKRFSLKSFNRAKKKLTDIRCKLRGKKDSDFSEDSAYDTSEVCLSPHGNQVVKMKKKKKRRLSWSFHDLRSNSSSKNSSKQHESRSGGSVLSGSSIAEVTQRDKRRKIKRRRQRRSNKERGSSDSGVEEYYSDYSGLNNNRSKNSNMELDQMSTPATLVTVKHGMSERKFRHWSQTNLQDELGYMP
ncbi:uncharacterized protein LOC143238833 [Tachypleus tridentatus]|uniref:uncharacterized protein LOC143238833 n=1 Tax=Tachypleus tridentatus TaxID=6853 RepID=UPI003FD54E43